MDALRKEKYCIYFLLRHILSPW